MRNARRVGTVNVAGWIAARMLLPAREKYHSIVTGSRSREDIGYVAVWIKGLVHGRNISTGEQLATRRPWLVSTDLPPLSVGRLEFTAHEDSEWLCFDAKLNEGRVPDLAVVMGDSSVPAGRVSHQLAPGVFLAVKPWEK